MKKIATSLFLLGFFVLTFAGIAPKEGSSSNSNCEVKALKKEGISKLSPYYYSSSKVTSISFADTVQFREIEVPLFRGEKYRMVFNSKALPKGITIEVFDKDRSSSARKPLFSTTSSDENIAIYEPEKAKRHYVRYSIPAGSNIENSCMVFVLGYQLTFIENTEE